MTQARGSFRLSLTQLLVTWSLHCQWSLRAGPGTTQTLVVPSGACESNCWRSVWRLVQSLTCGAQALAATSNASGARLGRWHLEAELEPTGCLGGHRQQLDHPSAAMIARGGVTP
jgi:hypothetical protein